MGELDINNAVSSDLSSAITDYSVPTAQTDGPDESPETTYDNDDWAQQLGYSLNIPEINTVINTKATWTVGKGFKADETTEILLDQIKGWGKDTFNTILENLIRTYHIGGDAFAEIIRDKEDNIINLKPLDPGIIRIVANEKGMIKRYEQTNKGKTPNKKFKKEDILHLARNRTADEIHGKSMIDPLVEIILMKNEAMAANKQVMQRHIKPLVMFKLDTDDQTKIDAFKAKADKVVAEGENIYIPKDAVEFEILSVAPNSTLNPLPWITYLDNFFYEAAGVPKIVVGGSGEFTEATAKIAYLVFQQTIEEEQLFMEEQLLAQLNIVVELEFPVSLENELLTDNKKDGAQNIDPSETTAGEGQ